jgi:hypothetical protein
VSQEKLYQVSLPRDHFAITVGELDLFGETEWVVKQTAPAAHWMAGITFQDIKMWVHQQGGSIKELRDSRARIVVGYKTRDS